MPPFARLAGFAIVLVFAGAFLVPRFAFAQPYRHYIPPTPKPSPSPSPSPASEPPQVPPIEAEFYAPDSKTSYSLVAKSGYAARANQKWNLALQCIDAGCPDPSGTLQKPKPAIDAGCAKTKLIPYPGMVYGFVFVWHHGDLDGCDHKKEGPSGHQGLITLTLDNEQWVCTAKYYGTHSGTGPPPVCAKKMIPKIFRRLPI